MQGIPKKLYRLRWRFEYVDGTSRRGVWDLGSDLQQDKAAYQKKEGLLFAIIEGEDVRTFEQRVFVECPGQDYVSCLGEAYTRLPNALGLSRAVSPKTYLSGISFVTRAERILVFVDGTIERRELSKDERKQTFMTEHKLGSGKL
jgi:hypothetical protein